MGPAGIVSARAKTAAKTAEDRTKAGREPAVVATAPPVGQWPIRRHSAAMDGPPAAWIAPHTPPPGARDSLAALTMASTDSAVMSPWTVSTCILEGLPVLSDLCGLIAIKRA